ncbi:hypothetical protein FB45DRAFT_1032854 [Roridomyces roridus]|uniref:Uncharacterized protein n=1 Tax=Roridomyces roridus TaxID=1738132 RepID=A0AAD7FHE4_9AGAR|nr:hypothetical protein FB45DRAFT_1032854 [Roridomyces roridus]
MTHYHGKDRLPRQLDILSAAPNLGECRLAFYGVADHPAPESRSRVLDYLSAPSLHFLRVEEGLGSVLPFIQRSSCCLRVLAFVDCRTDPKMENIVIDVLRALPLLEHFLVDGAFEWAPLYTAMTISELSRTLCPSLKFFGCGTQSGSALQHSELDALLSMVRSRRGMGSAQRLRSLRVLWQPPSDRDPNVHIWEEFAKEAGGIDVVLVPYNQTFNFLEEGEPHHLF